jgi:hypothetical protein
VNSPLYYERVLNRLFGERDLERKTKSPNLSHENEERVRGERPKGFRVSESQ